MATVLEQILIRQSWQPSWEEALVFDQDKRLIEGTQSNVFLRKNNSIITPALNDAGVAGVMRQFILNNPTTSKLMITQGQVTPADIAFADELVLCNSVMESMARSRNHRKRPLLATRHSIGMNLNSHYC